MKTHYIEASNEFNWGKFLVLQYDWEDWMKPSVYDPSKFMGLVARCGWTEKHLWVLDLATGEGACFLKNPKGRVERDLEKHRIWVCPLFKPFLAWLYQQTFASIEELPENVLLVDAPSALRGERGAGPEGA